MIAVPFAIFCLIFMLLCVVLLCVAAVRWFRTPPGHADRLARRDTMRLMGLLSISLGLALARTQFLSTSLPFLALSAALLPFGIAALWLLVRLAKAYRQEKSKPVEQTLPEFAALQSRISSDDRRKR